MYDINSIYNKCVCFSIDIVKLCNLQEKELLPLVKPLLSSVEELCDNLNACKQSHSSREITEYIISSFQKAALTRYWLDILISSDTIKSENNYKLLEDIEDIILCIKGILKETDHRYYNIINK